MFIPGLLLLHIVFLHASGSSNQVSSIGCDADRDTFSSFYVKEGWYLWITLLVIAFSSVLLMDASQHADNFIQVDRLVTPAHITPEWYFLPFYAILRSIDCKIIGVIMLLASLAQLGCMAWCHVCLNT
jgi:ubiquinol-cytochrome c reductase cytochrome b subunit